MYVYEKSGEEIYRQSFATIHREADLSRFCDDQSKIVIRMIHACGMVDLAGDVVISDGAMAVGRAALDQSEAIICDVQMVKHGIIRRNLLNLNPVLCNVATDEGRARAEALGTTRSAGGIESLVTSIASAIVVIGNAPTALFHLLEMLDRGVAPPALIIGCPVGFVGAEESKQALIDHTGGVPFITVRGRRGGSAIAAAALNAIAAEAGA